MAERMVVTGMGMITALGNDPQGVWEQMIAGKSGLASWNDPELSEFGPMEAGRISLDLREALGGVGWRSHTRPALMACLASQSALAQARISIPGNMASEDVGIVQGGIYNFFDPLFILTGQEKDYRLISPSFFINFSNNSVASQLSILHKLHGVGMTFITGFTAGLEVMDFALQTLRAGRCCLMLAGTAEGMRTQLVASFARSYVSQDEGRLGVLSGFRPGAVTAAEACAQLVIEPEAQAQARGARALGEIQGFGLAQGKADDPAAASRAAIQQALDQAQLSAKSIGAILLSANGSATQDQAEATAVHSVFGSAAPRAFAPKGALGETFHASGSLALALALLCLEHGRLPGTLRLVASNLTRGLRLSAQPQPLDSPHILILAMDQTQRTAALVVSATEGRK